MLRLLDLRLSVGTVLTHTTRRACYVDVASGPSSGRHRMTHHLSPRSRTGRRALGLIAAGVLLAGALPGTASAAQPDPRIGLGAGWLDAQSAISNLEQVAHRDKPAGM